MKATRLFGFNLLVAVGFLVVCDQARASFQPLPTDLGTLTTAGNYTMVGSYTYTFSNYHSESSSPGNAIAASSIGVSAVTNPNVGFELTGGLSGPSPSTNDISFAYLVSTTGPAITSVTLNGNGATNGGTASITEDVYTSQGGTYIGQLVVTSGNTTLQLGGSYSSLYITEDILFNTYTSNETSTFSIINQTFAVPEPSSMALVCLGLAGAGLSVRRRNRKSNSR